MAYVPGYTGDVFISYSHLDDTDGWVTELKSKIGSRLTADLGGEPQVWFDADRLRTGDIFKQKIHDDLSNSLILLAIVSPSYLKSEFCMERELEHFLNELGREVFQLQKVRLLEGTTPPVPEALHELLFDEGTDSAFRGEKLDLELNRIISALRQKMERARASCKKIYLAHPKRDDVRSASKDLGRALHRSGVAVIPEQIVTERTLESKIQKWIEDAGMSIHIRVGSPDPLSAIQLRIAERVGTPMIVLDHAPRQVEFSDIVGQAKDLLTQFRRRGEVYFIYDYNDNEPASRLSPDIERFTGRRVAPPQPGETYQQSKVMVLSFSGQMPPSLGSGPISTSSSRPLPYAAGARFQKLVMSSGPAPRPI